jgi:predicted ATPase
LKSYSVALKLEYDYDSTTGQSRFVSIMATLGDVKEEVSWVLKRQKTRKTYTLAISEALVERFNAAYRFPEGHGIAKGDKIVLSHEEKFLFRRSSVSRKTSHIFIVRMVNDTISTVMDYLEKQVFYLAPLRSSPSRSYIRSSHNLAVGVRGEHTPSVLANLEKRSQKVTRGESDHTRSLEAFQSGLAKIFPGHVATTKTFDELVKLKIQNKETGDYVASDKSDTITDVGFGFSQVFPILVQSSVMPESATLIVEQPELHLHPLAQTRLAAVIAEAAANGRKFIIETHSEHFVRGLQIAVSENRVNKRKGISKDFVNFFYVKKSQPYYDVLELNEYGEFVKDWPGGFFDESYRTIKAILVNKAKG